MIDWLLDTLVMTGALMVIVLLVRRPVGRWFGPQAAYALWALPMIRLVLPPLVLPGQPVPQPVPNIGGPLAGLPADTAQVLAAPVHEIAEAVPAQAPGLLALIPWSAVLVAVWLGGALVFLLWRAAAYKAMTRDLLKNARRIGCSGPVRIVESPAVSAPVAFGIFDKVVALPPGFLASAASDVSDYAIAHELEHHAGHDLTANIAVQPLFALHWFNPLAWAAWRAMRSDQEAACDGRVMRGRGREERARYGRLIASFAAGPKLLLAAPMAGPLTGDKPIIHRLKALAQGEAGMERKVLARSLFAASVIAVPLTATVSYAAIEAPPVPPVPELVAPAVPVPPMPPMTGDVSAVPAVPEMPVMPELPKAGIAEDGTRVEIRKTVTRDSAEITAEAERMGAQAEERAREALAHAPVVEETTSADGKVQTIRIVRKTKDGSREDVKAIALDSSCPAGSRKAQADAAGGGSAVAVRVCTGEPTQVAGILRGVRASIAADSRLDQSVRAEILSELDAEIASAAAE